MFVFVLVVIGFMFVFIFGLLVCLLEDLVLSVGNVCSWCESLILVFRRFMLFRVFFNVYSRDVYIGKGFG